MSIQIQIRRDIASNWTGVNPTLAQGEMGYETDTGLMKIGDGSTAWNSLSYFGGSGGGSWGSITGTITDQTDLMSCFGGKQDTLAAAPSFGCVLGWDGSSWTSFSPGTGSPGGSPYDVQYNDSGIFNGCSLFSYCPGSYVCVAGSASQLRLNHADSDQIVFYNGSYNYSAGFISQNPYSEEFCIYDSACQGLYLRPSFSSVELYFTDCLNISGNSGTIIDYNTSSNRIRFMNNASPYSYTFPCSAGNPGDYLQLDSNCDLQWVSGGGGSSAVGGTGAIQWDDGSGNFCGCCCQLRYDCSSCLFEQNSADHSSCLAMYPIYSGYELLTTGSYGGAGLTAAVHSYYQGDVFCVRDADGSGNYIYQCPFDAYTYYNANYNSRAFLFGYQSCSNAAEVRDMNVGTAVQVGYCCSDAVRFCMATYDDWVCWKDCEIEYNGQCNFVQRWHNGCTYGYNQLNSEGLGCGLVINQTSNTGGCGPIILAQDNLARFEIGQDSFVRTISTLDICGGLCVYGTTPASDGTYLNPTSITIQCGIITAIS